VRCAGVQMQSSVHRPAETCPVPTEGSAPAGSWDWEDRGHVSAPAGLGSTWRSYTHLYTIHTQYRWVDTGMLEVAVTQRTKDMWARLQGQFHRKRCILICTSHRHIQYKTAWRTTVITTTTQWAGYFVPPSSSQLSCVSYISLLWPHLQYWSHLPVTEF